MFEAFKGIACFVTATVSFIYATRIAWVCGRKCQFREEPAYRTQMLLQCIPGAMIVYFFGFLIVFSYFVDGYLSRVISALTSALILSNVVVSMGMPELRRKPQNEKLVLVELNDGSICKMAKKSFNIVLSNGKVAKFHRADGWVSVGRDSLRSMTENMVYTGVERRDAV